MAKKPTTAELIQKLSVQVAELRGRVERLEASQTPPACHQPRPWYWFKGIEHR